MSLPSPGARRLVVEPPTRQPGLEGFGRDFRSGRTQVNFTVSGPGRLLLFSFSRGMAAVVIRLYRSNKITVAGCYL